MSSLFPFRDPWNCLKRKQIPKSDHSESQAWSPFSFLGEILLLPCGWKQRKRCPFFSDPHPDLTPTAPAVPTLVLFCLWSGILFPAYTDLFSFSSSPAPLIALAELVNISHLLLLLSFFVGFRGGSADWFHCGQPLGPHPVSGVVCELWSSSIRPAAPSTRHPLSAFSQCAFGSSPGLVSSVRTGKGSWGGGGSFLVEPPAACSALSTWWSLKRSSDALTKLSHW